MAVVLTYAAQVPIVKVGRMAGQFAKPRSSAMETREGVTLPAYRGDAVNGFDFSAEAREPDPQRLLEVYHASSATLNLTRAFVTGGFAHLRSVHSWNADFVKNSAAGVQYQNLANEIDRALAFMVACGIDDDVFRTVDFYSSHEALILEYEHALTRIDSRTGQPYGTSGHFLWIGERTRQLHGAHVELLRHVRNPLGVKLGPTSTADNALELADRLDPDHESGRITFITRMGAGKVRDVLPDIVAKVTASGRQVAWVCDPMHGNTFEARNGYKTRAFSDVMAELNGFFDVHEELGTWPGGVHVELTGDDVTESARVAVTTGRGDLRAGTTLSVTRVLTPQSVARARVWSRSGSKAHRGLTPSRRTCPLPFESARAGRAAGPCLPRSLTGTQLFVWFEYLTWHACSLARPDRDARPYRRSQIVARFGHAFLAMAARDLRRSRSEHGMSNVVEGVTSALSPL